MPLPAGCEITVNHPTAGPITAKVVADGVAKGNSLTGGGPWRDIIYQVTGADSDNFIDAILGAVTNTSTPGTVANYPFPHAYPGNTNIFALEAVGELVGPTKPDPTKVVTGDLFHVRVRYGVPPYDVAGTNSETAFGGQSGPWYRDTCRGYMESQQIDGLALTDNEGNELTKKFEVQMPLIEFRRSRSFVPYLFLDKLLALVGKVNDYPMWGMARGTLRVEPWDTGTEVGLDGKRVNTLDTTLIWRPVDWNAKPKDDGSGWTIVRFKDNDEYPYPYMDLSPLFT